MKCILPQQSNELKCKALWDLYVSLKILGKPYVMAKSRYDCKEYLYYIESVEGPYGEDQYSRFGYDDIADLPIYEGRDEWIDLVLIRMACEERIVFNCRIKVNSEKDKDITVSQLKLMNNISIPSVLEIEKSTFTGILPQTSIERRPQHLSNLKKTPKYRVTDSFSSFLDYLYKKDISFAYDKIKGVNRITMDLISPNSPNGYVKSSIVFYENYVEVSACYKDIGFQISDGNSFIDLMRLVNFLNGRRLHMDYTPRFYITEGESIDITATWDTHYRTLDEVYKTTEYITGIFIGFMDALVPSIFGVLDGSMLFEDAIKSIEAISLQANK